MLKYSEFEAEIFGLLLEKYGLSFDVKKKKKKNLLPVDPWGMRMQLEHTTLI